MLRALSCVSKRSALGIGAPHSCTFQLSSLRVRVANYSTTVSSNPHFHPKDNDYNSSRNEQGKQTDYKWINKAIYGLSLVVFFKVAYDSTTGFWNYRKVNAPTQLQDIWNEVMLDLFTLAMKDPELQQHFGSPLRMGPPPLQSKSPLTLLNEGVSIGIALGKWSFVKYFGDTPIPLPQPAHNSNGNTTITDIIYNEDRSRATVMLPPKKTIPELPQHIPAPIRASLAKKSEPVVVPDTLPSSSSQKSNYLPNVNIPLCVGFLECYADMIQVELPLIGTKEKGMLSAFIYTENSQWKVKYARVLSQNNTIVKEIIPNTAVIGLEN